MNNFNFNNLEDLLDFLTTTSDFNDWEVVIFRLSATNGMEMNINTKVNDTSGSRTYIQMKKLKNMLNTFYFQNSYLSINMEIKLKFPNSLKYSLDPNNNYESFFVDFYSDQVSSFFTTTFLEKTKDLAEEPIKNWTIFITTLYNSWIDKKNNS